MINENTLQKLAKLSRLELSEEEKKSLPDELNKILNWMNELNEVNTDDIEPLTHLTFEVNSFREDEVKNMLEHTKALLNAPKKDDDYFRVPKVLE
ncbi:MAG: Asp-tRNA(Asn)/Glu-tRNA(Gln) amidotransferase subunit GatC [Bacteroidetes bacterium]|nr:MAG: Asp-tRNA(Asn)/Glu-tRNA(Gln) amidotransferase subunit GatC [Bacteroidota bacterium]TAG86841.1 MAG: Asp-tRNA(Asn)/Glu-tRNA(Gln) amidotransferase subunit GatC [Bacteroidota bacterium]